MNEDREWSDDESNASGYAPDIDENGIDFYFIPGFPKEQKPQSQWAVSVSANVCRRDDDPEGTAARGYSFALVVRPELMPEPRQNFNSLAPSFVAAPGNKDDVLETTRVAFSKIFDPMTGWLKRDYRGMGVWGTDDNDGPWVMVFERFFIEDNSRGHGWGTKLAIRMIEEVTRRARQAGKSVIVLTIPMPPERETTAKTAGLSAAERQVWTVQSKRSATAFWRSLGFVRLGETLFYGWTRSLAPHVVTKSAVRSEDLDKDAVLDNRYWHSTEGYTTWLSHVRS